MRDAATDPTIRASFENEPGFETSLLRDRAAAIALDGGAAIIRGEAAPSSGDGLEIVYDLPGLDEPLRLSFGDTPRLPSRLHTIIGYNGVGKTRLLASLGWVLAVVEDQRDTADFVARYGNLVGEIPDISAVLSVSYSAFDTFAIPGAHGGPLLERTYRYCGLRSLDDVESDGAQLTLKSIDAIREDFHSARIAAVTKLREAELADIFDPMLREPSFAMAGELPELAADRAMWEEALRRFSTGHTIVLTILVQLCAYLERRSLVLLDEPEMHLHPPLVAALLSSVQVALKTFDSFAIAATHSPVVAQEVPSSHVLMLRRASNVAAIVAPEVETFGENIGLLTSRIFHLDNSRSDFRRVLQELAADRTVDEIDELFPHGLSSQARVIVLSEQAARERP
jgi:predicted ATPase